MWVRNIAKCGYQHVLYSYTCIMCIISYNVHLSITILTLFCDWRLRPLTICGALPSQTARDALSAPIHLPSIFRFIIIIATMSKQPSYCPIRNYFKTHALELSDEKRTKLVDEWGYDTVESLKLMDEEEWSEIFDGSFKRAQLKIANELFKQLKATEPELHKCSTTFNLAPPDAAAAASTASSQHKKKKKNHTHDHAGSESLENMGFTYDKKKRKSLTSTFDSPDKNSSPNKSPRRSPRLAKASAAKMPDGVDVHLTDEDLRPRNSEKLLALPESNWRDDRCHCVGDCNLCVHLTDPADEDEKLCWDKDLITLDDLPDDVDLVPQDFEDPRGLYACLGCGLSKVSSQAEIKAAYKREKKLFHQNSLKTHPDKNPDNPNAAEEFRAVQERWNQADFAYSILGNNAFGMFIDRYNYDRGGERIREAFKIAFEAANPGKTFKVMADELREKKERAERYERRNATTKARAAGGGESVFYL